MKIWNQVNIPPSPTPNLIRGEDILTSLTLDLRFSQSDHSMLHAAVTKFYFTVNAGMEYLNLVYLGEKGGVGVVFIAC